MRLQSIFRFFRWERTLRDNLFILYIRRSSRSSADVRRNGGGVGWVAVVGRMWWSEWVDLTVDGPAGRCLVSSRRYSLFNMLRTHCSLVVLTIAASPYAIDGRPAAVMGRKGRRRWWRRENVERHPSRRLDSNPVQSPVTTVIGWTSAQPAGDATLTIGWLVSASISRGAARRPVRRSVVASGWTTATLSSYVLSSSGTSKQPGQSYRRHWV